MNGPELGDKVREIVTGHEGIATGQIDYLWGCRQFLVHYHHLRTMGAGSVTKMADEVMEEDEREIAIAMARTLVAIEHHADCGTRRGKRCDCHHLVEPQYVLARVLLREIGFER